MEKNNTIAALFGNNPDISVDERDRVIAELEKIGSLTFDFKVDEEGWVSQCVEVPGIIAGGTNSAPTSNEVESEIRSAIYSAFDVKLTPPDQKSPYFSIKDFAHQENGVKEVD